MYGHWRAFLYCTISAPLVLSCILPSPSWLFLALFSSSCFLFAHLFPASKLISALAIFSSFFCSAPSSTFSYCSWFIPSFLTNFLCCGHSFFLPHFPIYFLIFTPPASDSLWPLACSIFFDFSSVVLNSLWRLVSFVFFQLLPPSSTSLPSFPINPQLIFPYLTSIPGLLNSFSSPPTPPPVLPSTTSFHLFPYLISLHFTCCCSTSSIIVSYYPSIPYTLFGVALHLFIIFSFLLFAKARCSLLAPPLSCWALCQ